jgi:hypothetical protein
MSPRDPHTNRTPLDYAQDYAARGISVIPIPSKSKKPRLQGWQDLRLTEGDLPGYFDGRLQNIGGLNGEPSGNRVDVDVDDDVALALAGNVLPHTRSIFGRASRRQSHYIYVCDPLPKTEKILGSDGKVILELRSTGSQTLFPGSVHPSGELIEWDRDDAPARVHPDVLHAAIRKVAAETEIAKAWKEGVRHDASLALTGGLLGDGLTPDEV